MQRIVLTFVFSTFAIIFTATTAETIAAPPAPLGSVGDVATQTVEPRPRDSFATTFALYPTELTFGDVAYLTLNVQNVSNATRSLPGFYDDRDAKLLTAFERISVTADGIPGEYVAAPEFASPLYRDAPMIGGLGSYVKFSPGEKRRRAETALEFPPLEDWNAPFWAAVRDKLSRQKSVALRLRVEYRPDRELSDVPLPAQEPIFFETTLSLKRRDVNELTLISTWFEATPPNALPTRSRDGLRKGPRFHTPNDLPKSASISLNGKSYETRIFARYGVRKPSSTPSVAPTTLDGWRALEAKFAPSTLRDEITLTRLQLEYYNAPNGEASDAALQALVDWLRDRPEPQRAVLTESLRSNRVLFLQTPLKEKNAILCNKLTSDVDAN
ncbi:MAG: hypothetical protein IJZ10_03045 [Thermoguttaceae bacterium]|nr:hypothetical protein [Thermoguttaceae bacterium]